MIQQKVFLKYNIVVFLKYNIVKYNRVLVAQEYFNKIEHSTVLTTLYLYLLCFISHKKKEHSIVLTTLYLYFIKKKT